VMWTSNYYFFQFRRQAVKYYAFLHRVQLSYHLVDSSLPQRSFSDDLRRYVSLCLDHGESRERGPLG